MKHLAFLASIGLIAAAAATLPTRAQIPAPQPKAPKSVVVHLTVTPDHVNGEIDKAAKAAQDRGDAVQARYRRFSISWADNTTEFAALAKHSVMLLTVLSQKPEELPLKRAYIQAGGREVPVQQLSSWRSEIDSGRLANKLYGRYREDGFYLLPAGMLMREGVVLIDFAANRVGMSVVQLPTAVAIESAKKYPNPDPAPNAKPDAKALKAFIQRKFAGFPVP